MRQCTLLPFLPKAGVNVLQEVVVDYMDRPSSSRTSITMEPITTCQVVLEDTQPLTIPTATLPMHSHLFSMEPPLEDTELVSKLIRDALRKRCWPQEYMPTISLPKELQDSTNVTKVLFLCQVGHHIPLVKIVPELKMQVHTQSGTMECKLEHIASDKSVREEVFRMRFFSLPSYHHAFRPIEHQSALEIAFILAGRFGVRKVDVKTDVLGLWRLTEEEVLSDGRCYRTDRNAFEMALRVPLQVDRDNFMSYHDGCNEGGLYKIYVQVPQSDKYCKYCTVNREHDGFKCDKQGLSTFWPAQLIDKWDL